MLKDKQIGLLRIKNYCIEWQLKKDQKDKELIYFFHVYSDNYNSKLGDMAVNGLKHKDTQGNPQEARYDTPEWLPRYVKKYIDKKFNS